MSQPAIEEERDRFRRYRDNKRRLGMRLLRIWVPDQHAPGFAAEAARQAEIVNGAPDAAEVLDLIVEIADWGGEE